MSTKNDLRQSRRQFTRLGFQVTKTRGGHWRIEHPAMNGPVFAADTPSDHRAIKNLHAMLRRKMKTSNDN